MKIVDPLPLSWWAMVPLAVVVGVIAGCGAIGFRVMIAVFHNLFFLGQFSWSYDANLHTAPSVWGVLVILVPVVGAIGVAFIVGTFAPEAKGHGVPEVMDAIYYHDGRIRPVVAVVKSIASALSIGSGGSVGREGPIIQIGAAFGSTLGQLIRMPTRQRIVLIASGAGAGIAATFNAPIGGFAFAVELMLPVVDAGTVLIVALSIVVATAIGQLSFGALPSFHVPTLASLAPNVPLSALPWFLVCGVLIGLAATLMIRAIYWFEDRFDALPGNYYTRHALGMLAVGFILYGFMSLSLPLAGQPSHYYVEGVGYATILDILRNDLTAPGFLLLLAGAKLLATSLTLGSGASGGVFSPALFLGASLGAALATVLHWLLPGMEVAPANFAVAAMAGMIAGTAGAVITGIVMVLEMTSDYGNVLPIILTAVVAYAVRQHLCPASIYTLKLLRRGDVVPQGLQAWVGGARRAQDVMSTDFATRETARTARVAPTPPAPTRVLIDVQAGQIVGVAREQSASVDRPAPHVVVEPRDRVTAVLQTMEQSGARVALVMRSRASTSLGDLLGVITEREIASVALSTARLQA